MSRPPRLVRTALACAMLLAASPATAGLLARAGGAASLHGVRAVERLALDRAALADLRTRHHALVRDFPLGLARSVDLELVRFEPFTPGARVEVMEAGGPRALALPDQVYFTGAVAGEPGSHVLLIAGRRRVHGFVVSGGDVYPFGPDGRGGYRTYALRDADPTVYPPPGEFCGNDLHPEAVEAPALLAGLPALEAPPPPGYIKQAAIAIETDRELRQKFTSDQAALDYLASLAAAATAIYERDVAVRLRFSYIRLWGASPPDPWTASSTSGALGEVRDYWNNPANNMSQIAGPRTVVHFVSGKNVNGGIAYLNVLCNASFGYGVSQVDGHFDLSRPSQIWDVEVFTHEVGHNFGSPHTHCYSPPVDRCYNQEQNCYSGSVVASRGTIMSYCHLLSGGLSNIDLMFGSSVSARIGQSVAAASCLVDVPISTTTTTSTTSTTSTSTTTSSTTTTTTTSTTTSTSTTSTSTTTRPPTTTTSSTSTTSSTTTATTSTSTTTSSISTTTTTSTTTTAPTTTSTSTTTRPPTTATTSTSTTSTSTTTSTTTTTASTTTRPPTTSTTPSTTSTTPNTTTTSTTTTTTRPTTTTSTTTTTVPATTTTSTSTAPSTTTSTVAPTTTTTLPGRGRGDADRDGVADSIDSCPGTRPGELVDASGCSVCPCDGPRDGGAWGSRSLFLRCVRAEAKRRMAPGLFGRPELRTTLRAARRASCGRTAATRCCTYPQPDDAAGRCRIMRPSSCAARAATGLALDLGPGSCVPSPCLR